MAGRWLVLADDLSGAAEVASAAAASGRGVLLGFADSSLPEADVTVIDLDARLLDGNEASRRIAMCLARHRPEGRRVALKIDSVLRGPVLAMITTCMRLLGLPEALLLPSNPATARTVIGGRLQVDGRPLSQSVFARDPDHPAASDMAVELLGCDRLPHGMRIGDASDEADLRRHVLSAGSRMLLAGSAGLFRAVFAATPSRTCTTPVLPRLLVSGTIAGAPPSGWPLSVVNGPDDAQSLQSTMHALIADGRAAIRLPAGRLPDARGRLEHLADMVDRVVASMSPIHLLATGGSTASVIVRRRGWSALEARGSPPGRPVILATGDSRIPLLTVKPGSYPWPASDP